MNANMKCAIERLRELANGDAPENTCVGLCGEMKPYPIINIPILAEGWSKHSGSKFYPIPATSSPDCSALDEYSRTMNLWCGKQGELRRELCSYIADKLEKGWAGNENL